MLIDLKAHYLDLIVNSIEAGGNACLHQPLDDHRGAIYAVKGNGNTSADYVMFYGFDDTGYSINVQFQDERPTFRFNGYYVSGLEKFWPEWRKALSANRLPDKSHEPERGPEGDYSLLSARNQ